MQNIFQVIQSMHQRIIEKTFSRIYSSFEERKLPINSENFFKVSELEEGISRKSYSRYANFIKFYLNKKYGNK